MDSTWVVRVLFYSFRCLPCINRGEAELSWPAISYLSSRSLTFNYAAYSPFAEKWPGSEAVEFKIIEGTF